MKTVKYKQWITKQLEAYRNMSVPELLESYGDNYFYIDGQVESGNYSSQDIWGNFGHVDRLNIQRKVINEKREEEGLPLRQWTDEYHYSDTWFE